LNQAMLLRHSATFAGNQAKKTMKPQFEKNAGISLVVGATLMVLTMILHPAGGDLAHLGKIQKIIIISHSLALLSIPFSFIGALGITRRIGTENFFSLTALSILSFGLVAAMGAAATNGLALPFFVEDYQDAPPAMFPTVNAILRYNFALNQAFDYMLIGAMFLAILFWSFAMLDTKTFNPWIAYLGLMLTLLGGLTLLVGHDFTSLSGFRVFILGSVVWIINVGLFMIRGRAKPTE
jgi:hypothetical protein